MPAEIVMNSTAKSKLCFSVKIKRIGQLNGLILKAHPFIFE